MYDYKQWKLDGKAAEVKPRTNRISLVKINVAEDVRSGHTNR